MRSLPLLGVLLLAGAPALHAARKAPPAPDASAVVARDTHDKDKVTVAAEPFDTRSKGDFFRNDYVGHSILPIRIFVKNDSDTPLDLSDVRIQFIAADGTKLPAATPDEMNRRLFRFKDIQPRHVPGTPITYHTTPVDKKIQDDDKDFSFTETTVPPHTTATGFLFYDTRDLDDPVLRHAEIYVKQAHFADAKHTELFAFTVPLDKYLEAEKAAKASSDKANADKNPAGSDGKSTDAKSKSE
jgi:hypothetical protein